jgi:hypothetical protein
MMHPKTRELIANRPQPMPDPDRAAARFFVALGLLPVGFSLYLQLRFLLRVPDQLLTALAFGLIPIHLCVMSVGAGLYYVGTNRERCGGARGVVTALLAGTAIAGVLGALSFIPDPRFSQKRYLHCRAPDVLRARELGERSTEQWYYCPYERWEVPTLTLGTGLYDVYVWETPTRYGYRYVRSSQIGWHSQALRPDEVTWAALGLNRMPWFGHRVRYIPPSSRSQTHDGYHF